MNPVARKDIVLKHRQGLHARTAGTLAKLAKEFSSTCTVSCCNKQANARSILELLTLCAAEGARLTIECQGNDSLEAVEGLYNLILHNFEEPIHA